MPGVNAISADGVGDDQESTGYQASICDAQRAPGIEEVGEDGVANDPVKLATAPLQILQGRLDPLHPRGTVAPASHGQHGPRRVQCRNPSGGFSALQDAGDQASVAGAYIQDPQVRAEFRRGQHPGQQRCIGRVALFPIPCPIVEELLSSQIRDAPRNRVNKGMRLVAATMEGTTMIWITMPGQLVAREAGSQTVIGGVGIPKRGSM